MTSLTNIDDKLKAARVLYFKGTAVKKISKIVELSERVVWDRVKGRHTGVEADGWEWQRNNSDHELVDSFLEERKSMVGDILKISGAIVLNGLKKIHHQITQTDSVMSPKELKDISDIHLNFDKKAAELDPEASPDDFLQIPATLEDLRAAIEKDPFIDIIELKESHWSNKDGQETKRSKKAQTEDESTLPPSDETQAERKED